MTASEIAELVTMLIAAYPRTAFTDETSAVYEAALQDLERDVCHAAMVHLVKTSVFFPTVAEIRKAAVFVQQGPRRPGGDAWGDVVAAMKRYGYTRTPGIDFQFSDPLVARAVAALGWPELCGSTNAVADRARFIELYDHHEITEREHAQISSGARPAQRTLRTSAAGTFAVERVRELGSGGSKS